MNTQTFNHTPHKRRKKLLSWLLVLCLCLGLLPTAAWADETSAPISEIKFSIAEPKAGETPAQTAESLTDGVGIDDVSWMKPQDDIGYTLMDDSELFESGKTYLFRINAVLKQLYKVSADATATVNDSTAFFAFDDDCWNKPGYSTFGEADFYICPDAEDGSSFDIWLLFQVQEAPKPEPEPTVYHVNFSPSEHGSATATPGSGIEGASVRLEATPNPGYHFKSWSLIQANGATLNGDTLTIGSGNVTVAAEFAEDVKPVPSYSITIERSGQGSTIASDYYGKTGDRIVLTATPAPDWQFQKWTLLTGNGATLDGNILTIGSSNINVRAEFVAVTPPDPTYTMTVETSGHGTASASAKSGKQGETVALTAAADDGYQLTGWTLVQANGAVLKDNLLTIGTGNVTVRADFEPLPPPEPIYTVTVETDGHGTASSSARSGKYRDAVTLNAAPDTGWRLKTWHIVQGMDSFVTDNVLTIGTENMTVRAEFELGDPVYTCRWNANGGSWANGAVTRTGLSLPSPAPTRSGWTFSGWYTSPDGGDRLEDTSYFRSGQIDGLDDNIVFYAHWTQNAPTPSGGGGGGGGGSAAPAASPSISGADAAASSARFSSALTAGEQAVGRIRARGLPALTPASAMPRTAVWLLRLLALLPGGAS